MRKLFAKFTLLFVLSCTLFSSIAAQNSRLVSVAKIPGNSNLNTEFATIASSTQKGISHGAHAVNHPGPVTVFGTSTGVYNANVTYPSFCPELARYGSGRIVVIAAIEFTGTGYIPGVTGLVFHGLVINNYIVMVDSGTVAPDSIWIQSFQQYIYPSQCYLKLQDNQEYRYIAGLDSFALDVPTSGCAIVAGIPKTETETTLTLMPESTDFGVFGGSGGQVRIDCPVKGEVEVINMSGQVMQVLQLQKGVSNRDLRHLAKGLYFFSYQSTDRDVARFVLDGQKIMIRD